MADNVVHHHSPNTKEQCEDKSDHGLLDCFGKKDENKECEEYECKDEKNTSLLAKLHISDDNSSSSEDGEKKKKKKKEKTLKEKVEKKIEEDNVKIEEGREKDLELKEKIIEKIEEGKKNVEEFKEKIEEKVKEYKENNNEKHKENTIKYEEVVVHPPEPTSETEEKKGLIEKIKDKLPGGRHKPTSPIPLEVQNVDHHVDAESENKEKKEKECNKVA